MLLSGSALRRAAATRDRRANWPRISATLNFAIQPEIVVELLRECNKIYNSRLHIREIHLMANFQRFSRTRRARWGARRRTWRARRATTGFAASPAGKHKRLGTLLLRLARRARTIGNRRHATAMGRLGRRALALARTETRLWRQGRALRKRSYATHRALRAW
jgi:hypothetical protein